jgi:hypothetical protein
MTYRLGRKYLLMQQGFKPALINRYLHHPLAAVKKVTCPPKTSPVIMFD